MYPAPVTLALQQEELLRFLHNGDRRPGFPFGDSDTAGLRVLVRGDFRGAGCLSVHGDHPGAEAFRRGSEHFDILRLHIAEGAVFVPVEAAVLRGEQQYHGTVFAAGNTRQGFPV